MGISRLSDDYLITLVSTRLPVVYRPSGWVTGNHPVRNQRLSFWLLDTHQLEFIRINDDAPLPLCSGTQNHHYDMLCEGTTVVVYSPGSLWVLTLSQDYRTVLETSLKNPPRRTGQSVLLYNRKIYLQPCKYKPSSFPEGMPLRFDIDTDSEEIIQKRGSQPSPRLKYNSVGWRNKMILFGGSEPPCGSEHSCKCSKIQLFDVWALNLDDMVWEDLSPQISPMTVGTGMTCVIGNKMYLLGNTATATTHSRKIRLNLELFSFDIESKIWEHIKTENAALRNSHPFSNSEQLVPSRGKLFYYDSSKIYFLNLGNLDLIPMQRKLFEENVRFRVEGETIPAHKGVLSAVSPYFNNMLRNEMMEDNDIIDLPDTKGNVFKALLEYIYLGAVLITEDIAWDLLEESERAGIPELKRMCEEFISGILSVENVMRAINLAERVQAINLGAAAIRYASQNLRELLPRDTAELRPEAT